MKKHLSLFLALLMVFSLLSMPAYAVEVDTNEPPIIEERYAYFANAWAGLSRNSGNYYDVTGGAGSTLATMNIKVTVTLQKYNSGWQDLQTWSGEGFFNATAGGLRYIVSSGTYRTKMYAEIYHQDGTFGESVTIFSDHLIIP